MKRNLLILLTFLSFNFSSAFAFEEYIILADEPVKKITVTDNNIVEVAPVFTIMNEKNTIIVSPKKIGKTTFKITQKNTITDFDVEVTEEKTVLSPKPGFEMILFDIPPEFLELDKPPVMRVK